jgi:hypothetical protein
MSNRKTAFCCIVTLTRLSLDASLARKQASEGLAGGECACCAALRMELAQQREENRRLAEATEAQRQRMLELSEKQKNLVRLVQHLQPLKVRETNGRWRDLGRMFFGC